MTLNENQLEMYSQCMFLNESIIKTVDDIWYNRKKWKKDEIDICFILGFAGSGKSTLSRKMSKNKEDKIDYVELDMLVENIRYKDEVLKERSPFLYEFLNGQGKRYRGITFSSTLMVKTMVKEFVNFCINKQRSTKRKLIIEGIQLFMFLEPSDLEKYAVCIKGTSYLVSSYRATKREFLNKKIFRGIGSVGLETAVMPFYNSRLSKFIRFFRPKK